jgi:hypothetical protein
VRFKRAFRRLAAFRWIMPRLAALSSAEMIVRMSSAVAPARTRFRNVRNRVRTLRFCRIRVMDWRARLAADLVLAIAGKINGQVSSFPPA